MSSDDRMKLHETLIEILGSEHVYFQPPETVKLEYPCIVYSRRSGNTAHANDHPYRYTQTYDVTIIDRDPDSKLPEKLATTITGARYDRHYTADNLHHDSFYIPNY